MSLLFIFVFKMQNVPEMFKSLIFQRANYFLNVPGRFAYGKIYLRWKDVYPLIYYLCAHFTVKTPFWTRRSGVKGWFFGVLASQVFPLQNEVLTKMYEFPIAAITNTTNVVVLNNTFILFYSWRSKVWWGSHWAKIKVSADLCSFLEALEVNLLLAFPNI